MRQSTANALLAAQRAGHAMALVTPLDGGLQRLLDEAGIALLAFTDAMLAASCREALSTDRTQVMDDRMLITPHNPPLRLIIVGAVHITEALCVMAMAAGYAVTVIDPRSAFLRPERFPGVRLMDEWPQAAFAALRPDARTAVVLLTHDPKIDDPALLAVLSTQAFYIGALGSTRTHARRLQRLSDAGIAEQMAARVQGPAGLSIGARTPAEIAISVLAQMTQALRLPGASKS